MKILNKGVSPIIAKILIIFITIFASSIFYALINQFIPQRTHDTAPMEIIQITGVYFEDDFINIDLLNIGKSTSRLKSVYLELLSGKVLTSYSTNAELPSGGVFTLRLPRDNLTISAPIRFKVVTDRGTIATYVVNYIPYRPAQPIFLSFYPSLVEILNGTHIGGSLPDSLIRADGSHFALESTAYSYSSDYNPIQFNLLSGSHMNGTLSHLRLLDGESMNFKSSALYLINKTYLSEDYTIVFGNKINGSLSDTFYKDDIFINFSYNSSYDPIGNMNFTQNLDGWGFAVEGDLGIVNVTNKASSQYIIQRAITRTYDPNRTIHVVYSNGTYLGLSVSANGGLSFVDHYHLYLYPSYEKGCFPSMVSDSDNNIHILYQNDAINPKSIRHLMLKYHPNYGGAPEGISVTYESPIAHGVGGLYVSMFAHFIAMHNNLSAVEVCIKNASTVPARLFAEIRKVLADGTPDLSPNGLIASVEVFNVQNYATWVNIPINAELNIGERYALWLLTNTSGGHFRWIGGDGFYIGGLGEWTKYTFGGWTIVPYRYLLFRIPGWHGWTAVLPTTINSTYGFNKVSKPVTCLYENLTSTDLAYQQNETSALVYGENYYAQSFKPNNGSLSGIWLLLHREGNPSDDLYVEVRKSYGGLPDMSTSGLVISYRMSAGRIAGAVSQIWMDCIFPRAINLDISQTYWIVIKSPGSSISNCWKWYYKSNGDYPDGYSAKSSNGGADWSIENWDFSFMTFSSKKEMPALAWIFENGTHVSVLFLRRSLDGFWRNSTGGTIPDIIYSDSTGNIKITMCSQPDTKSIYFFIVNSGNLYYNRLFSWNPQQGWLKDSPSLIASGVSSEELSSAPDLCRNSVVLAFVDSSSGETRLRLFDSRNSQIDISPTSTSMRYPTITCQAGRIYVIYKGSSGICYRYYNESWSSEFYHGGDATSQLPSSIYRPFLIDFVWYQNNRVVYSAINPLDVLELEFSRDSINGNPYGSGDGSMRLYIVDKYIDFSLYRVNITFYSNFTSPIIFDNASASFAWRISFNHSDNVQNSYRLNSVRLILANALGNDIEVVYYDNNGGNGWNQTTHYSYINGIPLNLNLNTSYRLKIAFELSCLEPYDLSNITINIDDAGIVFSSNSMALEFMGRFDYNVTPFFVDLRLVASRDTNCTLRLFDYIDNRYSNAGEEGHIVFNISGNVIEEHSFKINSSRYIGQDRSWKVLLILNCSSGQLDYGMDLLNTICNLSLQRADIEFQGSSNVNRWLSLKWNITQRVTPPSVNVKVQLYNYTLGDYPTDGPGYINYNSSGNYETYSREIPDNPEHFRNATGNWSIRITAQNFEEEFYVMVDQLLISPLAVSQHVANLTFIIDNINVSSISNANYIIVLFTNTSTNVEIRAWNYADSSWTLLYQNIISGEINTSHSIDLRHISSGQSKISFIAYAEQPFSLAIDKLELDVIP